jgi:hypothetical protein
MYKFNAVDAPSCAGWWWCYPVPECEWYDRHRDGLVCNVKSDNGKYHPDPERLYVCGAFSGDCVGCSDLKYTGEVVGRWYGPLEPPNNNLNTKE